MATFRCKALHQPLFGYQPAAGHTSRCGPSGEWSVRPFRCVPICGRPTGRPTALVRDGEEVGSAADYPWHVTVYDVALDMKQICGGSLVTPKFFVSAAHCFHDNSQALPATRYMAAFAKTKRSATAAEPQEQFRPIAKIHMKDYGAKKLHYVNDIALAELEHEVAVTAWTLPVCVDWGLDLPDLRSGQEGTVVGFGNTALEASETLRFAKLPFVSGDVCKKLVEDKLAIFNLLPDKYCVGFVNNTSVAPGDSGGGMAFPNEDRAWYLRGVVSVGSSKTTTYSYFTNVTAFVPWISGIIRQGELSGRRCGVDVDDKSVVDGASADRQDFPWEVDVYLKQTSNRDFERLWSGVLVKPNLVITSVARIPTDEEPRLLDLSEYPASWLRVASRRSTDSSLLKLDQGQGAGNVSEVVRLFWPEDVFTKYGLLYSFALMELKQPLNLMPVCVDWTGGAQLQSRQTGTTFFESPENNTRTWKRFSPLNATKCDALSVSSANYHMCTLHQGQEPRHRSRSLVVNVDDSWYLRGIWFLSRQHDKGSVAVYTDMSDPGVLRWLDTIKDKLGKPTCGNIKLCEPLTAVDALPGHMPWQVAVADRAGRVAGSGLLVQPNAVLTVSEVLRAATGWDGRGVFPEADSKKVAVLFAERNGTRKTVSVARVSLNEGSTSISSRDVVLLELAAEDAILSTPVCLDLSGNVLQELVPGQLGMAESWRAWQPANHSLVGTPFMSLVDCSKKVNDKSDAVQSGLFCSEGRKGTVGRTTRGGGYLVNTGSQWYVQGLYVDHVALRRSDVMVAADLRDRELRTWLRKKLDKLEAPEWLGLADTGPKTCEGGRPAVTQCGVLVIGDDSPEDAGIDILNRVTRNHMQWNIKVHVDYGAEGGWVVRGGVLIKPNMVLTAARRLVSNPMSKDDARPISTSDLLVKYTSVDQVDQRIVEVDQIHIRPRSKARPGDAAYDLALLVLKTAVELTPVCVPAPGSPGLPRLAPGSSGLVEFDINAETVATSLIPVYYRTSDECKGLVNRSDSVQLAADEFCGETTTAKLESGHAAGPLGYALSSRNNGVWFLRGVLEGSWQSDVHSFASLDDPAVLEWLDAAIRNATPASQESLAPGPSTTSTTSRPTTMPTAPLATPPSAPSSVPTQPSPFKCGHAAADALVANQSLEGHLPWTVGVFRKKEQGSGFFVSAGVLVRDNVVLTEGITLVTPRNRWNESGDVRAVEPSKMHVVWVGPSGKRKRVEVAAVHVHERDRGPAWDHPWDVALLVLKDPVKDSAVACLDVDAAAPALPPIKSGDLGLAETWRGDFYSDRRLLASLSALGAADCRKGLPDSVVEAVTVDRFCVQRNADSLWDGATFLVRWRGSWFLRGIKDFSFLDSEGGPHVFADLNDDSVRDWMREKMPRLQMAEASKRKGPSTLSEALYFQE